MHALCAGYAHTHLTRTRRVPGAPPGGWLSTSQLSSLRVMMTLVTSRRRHQPRARMASITACLQVVARSPCKAMAADSHTRAIRRQGTRGNPASGRHPRRVCPHLPLREVLAFVSPGCVTIAARRVARSGEKGLRADRRCVTPVDAASKLAERRGSTCGRDKRGAEPLQAPKTTTRRWQRKHSDQPPRRGPEWTVRSNWRRQRLLLLRLI